MKLEPSILIPAPAAEAPAAANFRAANIVPAAAG